MIGTIEAPQADAPQFEVPRDLIVLPTTWVESGSDPAIRINADQSFTINKAGRNWLTATGRLSVMTDRFEQHVLLRRWPSGEAPTVPTSYVDGYRFTSWGLAQVLGDHGYLPGAEMVFSETSDPNVLVGDIVDRGPVKR